MEHVIANPDQKWEGFRPTAYRLNHKIWRLPITEVRCASDGTREEVVTTIGDVYSKLQDCRIDSIDYRYGKDRGREVTTDAEKLEFRGLNFHEYLLEALLRLKKHGDPSFSAVWFWYDSDHPTADWAYSYTFFVVCNDKIVLESVSFFDHTDSGFDPSVFDAEDESQPSWKERSELGRGANPVLVS